MNKNTTIFLLSDKSSGSTIFEHELLKNPGIFPIKYTPHNDFETLYWLKAAVVLGRPKSEFFNAEYPFTKRFAAASLKHILEKNLNIKVDYEFTKESLFKFWNDLTQMQGGIFFEKSPHHLNHWASTRLIVDYARANPDTKIIGLVRNPLSVVYSTMSRWYVDPFERQHKWNYTYLNLINAIQLMPLRQFKLVRYEDFIAKPAATYADVCGFLQIPFEEGMGNKVHTNSKEKWRDDKNFYLPVDESVKLTASYFGYDLKDDNNGKLPAYKIDRWKKIQFDIKDSFKKIKQKI